MGGYASMTDRGGVKTGRGVRRVTSDIVFPALSSAKDYGEI